MFEGTVGNASTPLRSWCVCVGGALRSSGRRAATRCILEYTTNCLQHPHRHHELFRTYNTLKYTTSYLKHERSEIHHKLRSRGVFVWEVPRRVRGPAGRGRPAGLARGRRRGPGPGPARGTALRRGPRRPRGHSRAEPWIAKTTCRNHVPRLSTACARRAAPLSRGSDRTPRSARSTA